MKVTTSINEGHRTDITNFVGNEKVQNMKEEADSSNGIDFDRETANQELEEIYLLEKNEEKINIAEEEYFPFIDPGYEEGFFFFLLARKGKIEKLKKLFIRAQEEKVHIDLFKVALEAAFNGQEQCLEYLLEIGGDTDPRMFRAHSAYSNHHHIKVFIDKKIDEMEKKDSLIIINPDNLA